MPPTKTLPPQDVLASKVNEPGAPGYSVSGVGLYNWTAQEYLAMAGRCAFGWYTCEPYDIWIDNEQVISHERDFFGRQIACIGAMGPQPWPDGPVSGFGYYGGKIAFRMGTTTADQWDDVNVGAQSFGMGYNAKVRAEYSFGFGYEINITATLCMALGAYLEITGDGPDYLIGSFLKTADFEQLIFGRGYNVANPLDGTGLSAGLFMGLYSTVPSFALIPQGSGGVGSIGLIGIGLGSLLPVARLDVGGGDVDTAAFRIRPQVRPVGAGVVDGDVVYDQADDTIYVWAAGSWYGVGGATVGNHVTLQAATPGTQQTGHWNISGTGILSSLIASAGGTTSGTLGPTALDFADTANPNYGVALHATTYQLIMGRLAMTGAFPWCELKPTGLTVSTPNTPGPSVKALAASTLYAEIASDQSVPGAWLRLVDGSASWIFGGGDGIFNFYNAARTGFNLVRYGGNTASFPATKRNGAALETRKADDSGFAIHRGLDPVDLTDFATKNFVDHGRTLTLDASVAPYTYTMTEDYDLVIVNNVTVANDFVLTLRLSTNAGEGHRLVVKDGTGSCSSNATITVQRQGADTVDGAAGYVLNSAYAYIELVPYGTTKWGRV